jgi:hypothetical protein
MGLLGLFWLWVAAFNGWVAWRLLTRRGERCPSYVPLVGAILAFVLLMLWDVKDGFGNHHPSAVHFLWIPLPRATRFLWIPLLLDVGSLPGIWLLFFYFLICPLRDRLRRWRRRSYS